MSCCHWLSVWSESSVLSMLRTPQWIEKGWKEEFYLTSFYLRTTVSFPSDISFARNMRVADLATLQFHFVGMYYSRCFVNMVSWFSSLALYLWQLSAKACWDIVMGNFGQNESNRIDSTENTDLGDMVIIAITIHSMYCYTTDVPWVLIYSKTELGLFTTISLCYGGVLMTVY